MSKKAFFIVIDGIDGCGSSTHSRLLAGFLESKDFKVHLTKEPSDSDIGKLLRKFLKDKDIPPSTDALLFAADRSIHYHTEIKKKLEEGYIVISDRYLESSIVYQSAQSDEITIEWIKEINKFANQPDLTIILDIDPQISLARKGDVELEKFEDSPFLNKVRDLYLNRAKQQGYTVINSDGIIEFVQEEIQNVFLSELEKNNIK